MNIPSNQFEEPFHCFGCLGFFSVFQVLFWFSNLTGVISLVFLAFSKTVIIFVLLFLHLDSGIIKTILSPQ
jgi:hypothetical protein